MKRGRLILISLSLIFLLSISFVSAGWFSDFFGKITGRVVDSPKQGDFNSDGCVNSIDLSDFQIHYGAVSGQANYESKYDLNSNDVIDFSDFITLAKLINEDSECVVQSASAATETDSAPATTTNDAETEEGGGINNNDATTNTNAESNVNSEETAVDGNSDEQIPDSSSTNSKASISKIQPESSQEDMSSPTGDFDNDGCVGFDDFLKFSESYGSEKKGWGLSILFSIFQGNKYSEEYDLNLDGKIDFSDFLLFVQNYGEGCSEEQASLEKELIKDPWGEEVPDKTILVTYKTQNNLDYNGEERKIIGSSLLPSLDGSGKYDLYILTTPNLDIKNPEIILNGNYFEFLSLSYSGRVKSFLGSPLINEADLYVSNLDYSGFQKSDSYKITIDYFNTTDNRWWWTLRNKFVIVNPENYSTKDSCNLIYASKYNDAINIAFVGDSYSGSELLTYAYDVEQSVNVFLSDPTIAPYKDRINVYRANYEGDLECDFGGGRCVPFYGKIFTLGLAPKLVRDEAFCCDKDRVQSEIEKSCGSRNYIMNVISNEERYGGTAFNLPEIPVIADLTKFLEFMDVFGVLGKLETGVTFQTRLPSSTFSHEIGHIVGNLPDYYVQDPECTRHECKMCSSEFPYSNQDLCYDKQIMVNWLNQWCKADVAIFKNKETFEKYNPEVKARISPYPNPFNPTSKNVGYRTQTVEFNVHYESGEDPCYVLMDVYNINGQLVDSVVSETTLSEGNHKLQWDGGLLGEDGIVASGTYIYEVSVGDKKDTVKATLIK